MAPTSLFLFRFSNSSCLRHTGLIVPSELVITNLSRDSVISWSSCNAVLTGVGMSLRSKFLHSSISHSLQEKLSSPSGGPSPPTGLSYEGLLWTCYLRVSCSWWPPAGVESCLLTFGVDYWLLNLLNFLIMSLLVSSLV